MLTPTYPVPDSTPATVLDDDDDPGVYAGVLQVMDSGMAHCTCQRGFFGDYCESHRPCNVYVCQNNGTCVYTPDADICYCKPGFSGHSRCMPHRSAQYHVTNTVCITFDLFNWLWITSVTNQVRSVVTNTHFQVFKYFLKYFNTSFLQSTKHCIH